MIRAAAELLAERGLSKSSVDAITKRAGVVKSALYWHFQSKEGLIAATLEHIGRRWVAEIEADVARQAHDPLGPLAHGTARLFQDDDALLRALVAATLEDPEDAPERRQAVKDFLAQAHAAVVRGTRATAPELPDPDALADFTMAFLIGTAVQHLLHGDPDRIERAQEQLARHMNLEANWQRRNRS